MMAQVSGTWDTYGGSGGAGAVAGAREDLANIIWNISPTETPFMMMIGRRKCKNTYHEWQIDSLADAAANIQLEGGEAAFSVPADTTRPGNRTQISWKTLVISGTLEVTTLAGRTSETAYQLMKRGKELKRDMEFTLTQKQAVEAGDSGDERQLAGLENWYETNTDLATVGTAGVDSGWTNALIARTDGTQRALTEPMVQGVQADAWSEGGTPTIAMCGSFNKRAISAFTGGSTRVDKGEDKALTAAIDLYRGDFGDLKVVPNRFSRDRSLHILDPSLWKVGILRPFKQKPLAVTGDAEKRMLLVEFTLVSCNEAGSGLVADLTTS